MIEHQNHFDTSGDTFRTSCKYYMLYFFIYILSFLWEVVYQAPRYITLSTNNTTYLYDHNIIQGPRLYDSLRLSIACLAPGFFLLLFSLLAILVRKYPRIERLFCFMLFIVMISFLLINPFYNMENIIVGFSNPPKSIIVAAGIIPLIEMAVCFIINKRTFNLNPVLLFSLAFVLTFISWTFFQSIHLLFMMKYEPIFPFVNSSTELGASIQEFCDRHNFPVENVYVEKGMFAYNALIYNFFVKKFTKIFVGSNITDQFEIDEVKGILEHEIGHYNLFSFLYEISMVSAICGIFLYFVRKRILSNSKNFTIKKVAENVMKLVLFLKLFDMIFLSISPIMEINADRFAYSNNNTCAGLRKSASKFLFDYPALDDNYTSNNGMNVFNPNSMYRTHPPVYKRIADGLRYCPADLKLKLYFQKN